MSCNTFVTPERGLDVCHGANETRIAEFIADLPCLNGTFGGCRPYHFPDWLPVAVKVLWVLFTIQAIVAIYLSYYFWSHKEYRRAVFSYTVDKGYDLKSFVTRSIKETDVKFGHKIARLPGKHFDEKLNPKSRILLSFGILYLAFLALVMDFFIDVYFLHGLSTDALIDVKYIHFDERALISMVFFEFTAFLCLPLTAIVFSKMAWKRNLRDNLYAELIIVSLAYVLEDGPELMLQYYWVDRYAGMEYTYPDGAEFSGHAMVVLSSLASLLISIIGIVNLIALYKEYKFWLKFRALRNFLDDKRYEWSQWSQVEWKTIIPSILRDLEASAVNENIVEKIETDSKRVRNRVCHFAYEHCKSNYGQFACSYDVYREKFASLSKTLIDTKIRTDAKFIPLMRRKMKRIEELTNSSKRNKKVLLFVAIFGLIPFAVNLLRLSSAVHQVFIWRKYKHNCLRYVVDNDSQHDNRTVSIDQRGLHKTECWGVFEWPFFILNGIGVPIHAISLVAMVFLIFFKKYNYLSY